MSGKSYIHTKENFDERKQHKKERHQRLKRQKIDAKARRSANRKFNAAIEKLEEVINESHRNEPASIE